MHSKEERERKYQILSLQYQHCTTCTLKGQQIASRLTFKNARERRSLFLCRGKIRHTFQMYSLQISQAFFFFLSVHAPDTAELAIKMLNS